MPDSPPRNRSARLVVSNTTPLIVLAGVGLLYTLGSLYGEISIPEAVLREYRAGIMPGDPDIGQLTWIHVQAIPRNPRVTEHLGAGETETLSLALSSNDSLVILDDLPARRQAKALGLLTTGSLGVLLEARRQGLIQRVRPILDQMVTQGRYISPELRAQVLKDAEESDDGA